MSHLLRFKKITEWIKNYDVLLFIAFISLGWLISWMFFVIFALLFVE